MIPRSLDRLARLPMRPAHLKNSKYLNSLLFIIKVHITKPVKTVIDLLTIWVWKILEAVGLKG
jgi:hypothetical protein